MTFTKSRTFRTPYEIGRNYTPRRHLLRIVRILKKMVVFGLFSLPTYRPIECHWVITSEKSPPRTFLQMQVTKGMTITVRYFKEDTAHPEIPAVGNCITLTRKADRIDPVFRTLQVGDTVVPFEDLVEVSGEGIMEIDQYLGISEE